MSKAVAALKLKLNKSIIEGLEPPEPPADRYYVYDAGKPSLAVCVATKAKTWYCCRRMARRFERVKLGRWPTMTVEQARKAVDSLNGQIADGKNPAEDRRTVRATMTLAELWEFYLTVHAKPHKRSWRTDEWLFNRFLLPKWGSRRLNEIKRTDVARLHASIGENSIINANRVRSLLSKMFNVADDAGYENPNPVAKVKPFKEPKRQRHLSADEVRRLFEALDSEPNETMADAIRFGLWTGARRGNWLSARWDEIDLAQDIWIIPAAKAKASKDIAVPLPPQALAILRRRKEAENASTEWVFPGRHFGPCTSPKKVWARACKLAELDNARMHDLRRTMATFAVNAGVPIFQVAKLLGHGSTTITESTYAMSQDTALRAASMGAAAAMQAAMTPKKTRKAKEATNGKA